MKNYSLTLLCEEHYTGKWETIQSTKGNPIRVLKKIMPRIDNRISESAIYLYPSVVDANEGTHSGGTGFMVSIRSNIPNRGYVYAVTNSHVIREAKSSVIRLNTQDGSHDVLPLKSNHWYHHPNGDDIAVSPIGGLLSEKFKFKHIPTELFITPQIISDEDIGGGDEIFMVGRFISHEGKQQNTPVLRFGNIAMMPFEPMLHPRGHLQESFLIETRSLPGFSGSPVFVHILPFSKRPGVQGWSTEKGPWLLGIDWGHIPIYEDVVEREKDDYGNDIPVSEGWRVKTNSGMAGVIPAWKLLELLNIEEFIMKRKEEDEKQIKKKEDVVSLDNAQLTKEQFHDILDKASQPIEKPESDQEQS